MTRRDIGLALIVNIVWLLAAPMWIGAWPAAVRVVVTMAALGVVPGLSWDWVWSGRRQSIGVWVARVLTLSTAWLLLLLVGFSVAGHGPTQTGAWLALVLMSNLGLVVGVMRHRRLCTTMLLTRTDAMVAAVLVLVGVLGFTLVATRVVPPLPDHDLEVQATGYALLHRLEPKAANDRGLLYYFAHPPLLHVFVGGAFLMQGQTDALQAYDTLTEGATGPGDPRTLSAIDARFLQFPHLLETRTPNIVFSALTLMLLGVWARQQSRRTWVGWLVPLAYATSPEVLVRSSYGGYFSATVLVALLWMTTEARPCRAGAGAGPRWGWSTAFAAWGALINHKLVVVPLGMWLGRLVPDGGWRPAVKSLRPVLVGFVVGTLAFWAYGLTIAPEDFVTDHLRYHLWGRVVHDTALAYDGYPSVVGLWRQFLGHTGVILLPVALAAGVIDLRRTRDRQQGLLIWMVLGWVAVASVIFSLVDWRMTKHLMPMVIGLQLLLVPGRRAPRWRLVGTALTLTWLIVWNVRADLGLVRDFTSVLMLPGW